MTSQSVSSLHRHHLRGSPFGGELAYAMSWGGQGKAQGHQPSKTKKEHHKLQQSYKGIVLHKSFQKSMFQTALKRLISQQNNN